MSTDFTVDDFANNDIIEINDIKRAHNPIKNLESGAAFYRVASLSTDTYQVDFSAGAIPNGGFGHAIDSLTTGQQILFEVQTVSPSPDTAKLEVILRDGVTTSAAYPLVANGAEIPLSNLRAGQLVSVTFNDYNGGRFEVSGASVGVPSGLAPGDILYSARSSPFGYLPADGSIVSQSSYPDLFAELGLLGGTVGPTTVIAGSPDATSHVFAIAYGLGKYVAVGNDGFYSSSTDGENWTNDGYISALNNLNAIGFFNDLFVVVGSSSKIYTSTDGTNWTARTAPISNRHLNGIAYGNGLYVISGYNGIIFTSPDAVTWTSRTTPSSSVNLTGVAFGDGVFVATGFGAIWRSTDGINWTVASTSVNSNFCVTYGDGLFVVGGYSDTIQTSPDGVTWTLQTNPVAGGCTILALTHNDGMYIGVGYRSTTAFIWDSSDGVNWNEHYSTTSTNQFNAVGAHNGVFVAGAPSGKLFTFDSQSYSYDRDTEFKLPSVPASGDASAFIKT